MARLVLSSRFTMRLVPAVVKRQVGGRWDVLRVCGLRLPVVHDGLLLP